MNRFSTLFSSFVFFIIIQSVAFATTYYSKPGLSNPTLLTNWSTNTSGTGSIPLSFSGGDIFIVQFGETMTSPSGNFIISGLNSELQVEGTLNITGTLTAAILTVQQFKLMVTGTLNINSGSTLVVNDGNGSGYDLVIDGTLNNLSTISPGPIFYGAGASGQITGTYDHKVDGDTIPTFFWDIGSLCKVSGIVNATNLYGLNQNFYGFTYESFSQLSGMGFASQLTQVAGYFDIQSTGSGSITLFNSNGVLTVGDFNQDDGVLNFSSAVGELDTIIINRNGGTFTQSAGTIMKFGNGGQGVFLFAEDNQFGSTAGIIDAVGFRVKKSFTTNGMSSMFSFVVDNGATLTIQGNGFIGGSGNFILNSGAKLRTGHSSGIETSGAIGAIQVSGTRTFNTGASYEYNGNIPQQTGNGLPPTVSKFKINNPSGVTLNNSLTITDSLWLQLGQFDISNKTVTLSGSVSTVGSGKFLSQSTGAVLYNENNNGQEIIARGSQYGNLTFSDFDKSLPNGLLKISGIFTPGLATAHSVGFADSIEFNGVGAQTIPAFPYSNILITGNRSGNVTLDNTNTIIISGVFNPSVTFSSGSLITTGSTIEFNGGNSQSLPPLPNAVFYDNIIVNKNDGGLSASGTISLTGDLDLFYGNFNDNGYTISVNGDIFGSGGYHTSSGGGKLLLTAGSVQHQIGTVNLGTLEIDDIQGAITTDSLSVQNLILTNGNFTLNNHLYINDVGTISPTAGNLNANSLVTFNGSGTVTGSISFDSVKVYGIVDLGTGSSINSALIIDGSGMIVTNPPTYSIGSSLVYITGGILNIGQEWNSTSGAGYPYNVFIENSTTLNLGSGGTAVLHQIAGNLTIEPGSKISMSESGYEMTAPLVVSGTIFNNGTITLSSLSGGNLHLSGNYIHNGTLTSNGSSVSFIGSSKQTIEKTGGGYIPFDNLIIANTDSVEIPFSSPTNNNLQINNSLDIQSGVLKLNGTAVDFSNGAVLTNSGGELVPSNHVIIFNGAASITGAFQFWNVNISGAVDFGSSSSIVNELRMYSGGSISINAPSYQSGSTLIYNSGGPFNRSLEWSSTSGPGYPYHVQVSNTTLLNIGDYFGLSIPLQTAGNVTIDAASEISMNVDGQEMWWPLTVNGNLINDGTITLAGIYNGSLDLKGNFVNNGSLISNTRPVVFSGNSDQMITRSTAGTVYFDSLIINNPSNVVEVSNSPVVALSISKNLTLQNGLFRLNGTVTDIGANATVNAVSGNFDTLSNDINFNGINSISGTVDFQNIKLFGSVDFGADSKLHKMMYLMGGGSVSNNPPLYLPGSTLSYHSGGTFYRGIEWSALSGPGYPYNVEINNNTLLNFGGLDQTLPTAIEGNLVVMGGSTFSMSEDGWEMSAPLTVYGSVQNFGNILLSYLPGNDLNIQRDLFQSDAVLTTNNSIISFFGTGNSTIDGIGTLDKLQLNKSSENLTLGNDLVINDSLFLTNGKINTGSYAVEMSNGSIIARTAGHVNGNLRKYIPTSIGLLETFEIGDSIVYTPVTVAFNNISANDFLTASTSLSGPSLTGTNINESKNVNRFWTLSAGAVTFDSFNATFSFDPTDIDSGANTNNFTLWRHNGGSWVDLVEGTRTATSTQGIGIDGFQTFAIGQLNTFTITPTASAGGNISPNIATEVPSGGNLNVTITPDAGFHGDSVLVDGISIGVVPSYDFLNVIADHTIEAFFSINSYSLTTNATNGSIVKTPDQPLYDHGTVVGLQAIPNYGYDFSGWSGDTTGLINPLSLTMETNKTIDANFVYSAPAAPQNLGALAGDGAVSLHWNPNSEGDIVKYYLYAGTSIYPTVIVDSTIGGLNDTLKIISGLTNYQQYYFRVTASDTNGYIGTYSDQIGAIPTDTTKPGVPQNLVALAGDGGVTIHWNGNSEGDFGKYYIYIGLSPNPTTITDSTTSIIDTVRTYTGLTNYQQYYFRIAAIDTSGNLSSYSDEISVMPYDQSGLPVPSSIQIIDSLQSNFTLQWSKTVGSDFRAYLIYGGTTPAPEFLFDSTTNINDTLKVFSGLSVGTPYYFFVTTIDTNGNESGGTIEVSASPYVNNMIIANRYGNGTITPIDTSIVTPGNSLLYSFVPGTHYHFDSVLVDGIRNVDSLTSYTFENIISDHTIDIYFSIDTYDLNIISDHGIVSKVPDSLKYSHGMEVQVSAVPNDGYSFSIWGGDTTTINNPFTITVDTIKNITAYYALNTYSLTTNAVNGTVIKTPDSSMYSHGMTVQLTAVPDSGYSFIGWSGDTVELNNPITVTMYNAKNVTANFSLNVYQVTASVYGDGTIVPLGISNVNFGDTVHYSFLPNTGSHFDSLVVDGVKIDSSNSYTFYYVSTAHSIAAYFSPNVFHHFVVEAGSGGAINTQNAGQTFTIRTTAVDSLENIVTSFTGNVWFASTDTMMGVLGGNYSIPFTLGQQGPQVVVLYRAGINSISVFDSVSGKSGVSVPFVVNPSGLSHFEVKDTSGSDILQQVQTYPFPIKIIASDAYGNIQNDYVGTVDVSISGAVVTQGGGTTPNFSNGVLTSHLMEINSSGFFSITVEDIGLVKSGASNFFTVVPNTYSMNSAAVNGSISPSGSTIANYADTISYSFSPNIGYHFDSLLVDGITKNDSTFQYTFVNITTTHTIDAYFSINKYPIVSTSTGNGSMTPAGTSLVNHGDSIVFTIQAVTGHHIDSVLIDTPVLLIVRESDPIEITNKKNLHHSSSSKSKGISNAMMDSSIIVHGSGNDDTLKTYSFTNVITDHLIDAFFSINKYTISASIVGNGSITPSGNSTVNYGDSIAYSIVPNLHNHIDSVIVDGINIGVQTSIVFNSINLDHSVTAYVSVNLNIAPLFTSALTDTAIARFDTLKYQYQAFDPDSGKIIYSLLNPPSGATIDSTGLLTFIPAVNANGINSFVVQAVDDSSAMAADSVTIRVNIYGDVSGNGGITAYDAALVLQNSVTLLPFTPLQERIGDVSGNGSISSLDASYLLQYAVGLISTFPGGLGKQQHSDAILSSFAFKIEKSKETDEYDLIISVTKPSHVLGIDLELGFDSALVMPRLFSKTSMTDSMTISSKFFTERVKLAMAGIYPLNNVGEVIKFTFKLKDQNYPKNALLFTMKKFVLNETDHTSEIGSITLNVRDLAQLPTVYKLEQNFPNPFNPSTTINYQLPYESTVKINIYNLLGQEVKTLIAETQSAGYYSQVWNGNDNTHRKISSGVYIYRIEAVGPQNKRFIEVKKMVMIK